MIIKNNERCITNKQLKKILRFLGNEYKPSQIVVCENRIDILRLGIVHCLIEIFSFRIFSILLCKIEGIYTPAFNKVCVFVFAQEYDDFHSKQLYSLHALLHELRHSYQYLKGIKLNESDCDNFATKFLNNNSEKVKEIMGWKDEWEVEEED